MKSQQLQDEIKRYREKHLALLGPGASPLDAPPYRVDEQQARDIMEDTHRQMGVLPMPPEPAHQAVLINALGNIGKALRGQIALAEGLKHCVVHGVRLQLKDGAD